MTTAEFWHTEALIEHGQPLKDSLSQHTVENLKRIQADALRHAAETCDGMRGSLMLSGKGDFAVGAELSRNLLIKEADKLEKP